METMWIDEAIKLESVLLDAWQLAQNAAQTTADLERRHEAQSEISANESAETERLREILKSVMSKQAIELQTLNKMGKLQEETRYYKDQYDEMAAQLAIQQQDLQQSKMACDQLRATAQAAKNEFKGAKEELQSIRADHEGILASHRVELQARDEKIAALQGQVCEGQRASHLASQRQKMEYDEKLANLTSQLGGGGAQTLRRQVWSLKQQHAREIAELRRELDQRRR